MPSDRRTRARHRTHSSRKRKPLRAAMLARAARLLGYSGDGPRRTPGRAKSDSPTARGGRKREEGLAKGTLREDSKQLLRVAYERRVQSVGDVTQVDLVAAAEPRGLSQHSPHFAALVDFMEVAGWVEEDLFVRDASGLHPRRITARGLQVLKEG